MNRSVHSGLVSTANLREITDDGKEAFPFVVDIEPFLYGRPITYVDVGAHVGSVMEMILTSSIYIREAHLIEPNPKAFAILRDVVSTFKRKPKYVSCHNIAISSEVGKVAMRDEGGMTHVVREDTHRTLAVSDRVFEAETTTLDRLAQRCNISHVGLLKVDVEGHELAVFEGAKRLLESQGVDVIYVEAGVNPEGDHHCYYRDMEDYLREYGYRLFKIYEQKNEWLDDSPLLRRINLAFLSEAFAAANPYKVTRQLFQSRSREAALADELAALKEQEARRAVEEEEKLEALRGELAARVSQVTKLTKQLEVAQRVHSETVGKHQAAIADYRAALDQAKADVSGLSAELSKKNADIVTLHQQLETEYRKHVGAVAARDFKIGEIRAALEETRNQVAVLQAELRDRVKEIVAITRQAEADRRLFFEAIAARDAQLEKAETRMAKLRGEMVDLSQRVEQLARHNESLLQSTSWRITAPLRHAVLWMRKLSRRRTFAVPGLSRTGEVEETRPN